MDVFFAGTPSGIYIYDVATQQLEKVIASGDVLECEPLSGLGSIDYKNGSVSFVSAWNDGSRAVYRVDPVVTMSPETPTALRARVGDETVHVNWNFVSSAVDGYKVYSELVNETTGDTTPLGTTEFPNTATRVLINEPFIENDQLYRFTVTAVKRGAQSPRSEAVFGKPGAFAAAAKPDHPILFLHGFLPFGGSSMDTFEQTIHFSLLDVPSGFGRRLKGALKPFMLAWMRHGGRSDGNAGGILARAWLERALEAFRPAAGYREAAA